MSFEAELKEKLNHTSPLDLSHEFTHQACVAIICRGSSMEDLEIGYILRAVRNEDRWSGQIGFPGGKRDPQDSTDLETAIRETREEIGLNLSTQQLVGRLDDIQARKAGSLLDFFIRPYVFHIKEAIQPRLNPDEVADFFWVPFKDILSEENKTEYELIRDQIHIRLPARKLPQERVLWGLSYLMTQNLVQRLQ